VRVDTTVVQAVGQSLDVLRMLGLIELRQEARKDLQLFAHVPPKYGCLSMLRRIAWSHTLRFVPPLSTTLHVCMCKPQRREFPVHWF
jgi:hypothetical protein